MFSLRVVAFTLVILLNSCVAFGFIHVPVTYIGIENGLSNNAVRCMYQDHLGFMWFGTYDGLNRYDGYTFKIFRNKFNDEHSLANNWITAITEDDQFQLWIGTRTGVSIYNPISSQFSQLSYKEYASNKEDILKASILSINRDKQGNLFVGTDGSGLLVYTKNTGAALQVAIDGTNTKYSVSAIEMDEQGQIWFFVMGKGLFLYNTHSQRASLYEGRYTTATCLKYMNHSMWIGTVGGAFQYTISTRTFKLHIDETNGLKHDKVAWITNDHENNLWIATDGGGITIVNPDNDSYTYLTKGNTKNSLTSEAIYSVLQDKEKRMWIGTLRGGINVLDPNKKRFQTVSYDPFIPNSLPGNFILSFCEDHNGILWIGTDGKGLSKWDRKTNNFANYSKLDGHANGLTNDFITCIVEDNENDIWLSTYGGGIFKFDKSTGKFVQYSLFNSITHSYDKAVFRLYKDKEGTLWAGCIGGGLYVYNKEKRAFELYDNSIQHVLCFNEDKTGTLWIGSFEGLFRLSKKDKILLKFKTSYPVRDIYEDKGNKFWVATEGGGLLLFNRITNSYRRFTDANGLCNNSVLNILEDSSSNLWLSTFNGISKLQQSNFLFTNFYQNDGLQSNQFNYNAAIKLQTGELAFGGIKGFNIFSPPAITSVTYKPSVILTDIWVNNKLEDDIEKYISKASLDKINALRVPFSEAVLSIRFAALEYTAPDKIMYAYYLEGWDKQWNYSNLRTVNYSSIREGTYILWIKSTDADGVWNESKRILSIKILPPWYRSWWAYFTYILAVAFIAFIFYRNRVKEARLKYKIKLTQLEAQKEKEIHENRQSFFTNITHEFRTPLTLIINPLKDVVDNTSPQSDKQGLHFVYRNARRLLSLVDQLLLFRKTETDTGHIVISKLNFVELCHETYLLFSQQAKAKHIQLKFSCQHEEIEVYGDKEKLEIVVYNLMSNAMKYTPAGGEILFSIREDIQHAYVSIQDSGPGIPIHEGEKLFQKYYRVKNTYHASKPGFGIGLYLVQQFVLKHHGSVQYVPNNGKGVTFTVTLLKGITHFHNEEIFENKENSKHLVAEIAAGDVEMVQAKEPLTNGMENVVSEKHTILIVDDNAQMRGYLAQVFQNDFMILEGENGEDGLKMAKQYQPDIIISDVVMEGMSGIEFCKTVKESATLSHIPLILITGSYSPQAKLKGIEYGADDYITKPFEKNMLVARVSSLIQKNMSLKKYFYNEITHQPITQNISVEYKEFLDTCIQIVEQHLDNDEFNIQLLAREIGMSHSNLYKKIKSISGQSANSFIRYIRLRKAAEMFINTGYNINETAFYVGMKDVKYFREQFTKTFGLKPSDYIEKYRKKLGKNYKLNRNMLEK